MSQSQSLLVLPRRILSLSRASRPLCTSSTPPLSALPPGVPALDLPDPTDPSTHPLATLPSSPPSPTALFWRARPEAPRTYIRTVDASGQAHSVGKRKRAVARVALSRASSTGTITVNGRNFVDVFPRADQRDKILRPFLATATMGKFDVQASVKGGGSTGQTEAIRHGIAKAMLAYEPGTRSPLKKDGLLTRDSRIVESKKYGLKCVWWSGFWSVGEVFYLRHCFLTFCCCDCAVISSFCFASSTGKRGRLRHGSSDSVAFYLSNSKRKKVFFVHCTLRASRSSPSFIKVDSCAHQALSLAFRYETRR